MFPEKCIICENLTDNFGKIKVICSNCLNKIKLKENNFCPICNKRSSEFFLCFFCFKKFNFKRIIFAGNFKNPIIERAIKDFKYRNIDSGIEIFYYIFEKLFKKLEINLENKIFVPVPLEKQKLKTRGFNQNEKFLKGLSRYLNKELEIQNILIKPLQTLSQTDIKIKSLRYKNVKDVFKINKIYDINKIKEKEIILVDDVFTTGATLNECAKVLLKSGFKKSQISALVLAKG